MNQTNMQLAIRAQERPHTQCGLFGHFKAIDTSGSPVEMAFLANRYAYVGSPLCLHIWANDGLSEPNWMPYVDLTKNVRPNECLVDEIIVKTYSENEHLRETLLKTGYFKDTGKRIESGWVDLEIWRITSLFVEAFDRAHGEFEAA